MTHLRARFLSRALIMLAIAACGDDDVPAHQGAPDATMDAPIDAPKDATGDAIDPDPDDANVSMDASAPPSPRVLVFTRTTAFRHDAIAAAIEALTAAGTRLQWSFTFTEDATLFTDASLANFDVVAFVLTSGDVLATDQEQALMRFVQAGNGWIGVHSATDTEYDWPWYGELVGAYFKAHPAIQSATLRVERTSHLATQHLGEQWLKTDEWYGFRDNPRDRVHVLLSVDEASFNPGNGAMGDHPIAWYHAHDGGRAFYTALGHGIDSWSDPTFMEHVLGGIAWASGSEWENVITVDGDGVAPVGEWSAHQGPGDFTFQVARDAITMTDLGGANQHIVRRGVQVDTQRPYTIEGLFRVPAADDGSALNSFCFNLNVAGDDNDLSPPSTWAINMDFTSSGTGAVMKHMGFTNGTFASIGETALPWAIKGTEYLLRVEVGAIDSGVTDLNQVTASVFDRGVLQQRVAIDYTTFPFRPIRNAPARIGANTHGTDWSLRSLRVYYSD